MRCLGSLSLDKAPARRARHGRPRKRSHDSDLYALVAEVSLVLTQRDATHARDWGEGEREAAGTQSPSNTRRVRREKHMCLPLPQKRPACVVDDATWRSVCSSSSHDVHHYQVYPPIWGGDTVYIMTARPWLVRVVLPDGTPAATYIIDS